MTSRNFCSPNTCVTEKVRLRAFTASRKSSRKFSQARKMLLRGIIPISGACAPEHGYKLEWMQEESDPSYRGSGTPWNSLNWNFRGRILTYIKIEQPWKLEQAIFWTTRFQFRLEFEFLKSGVQNSHEMPSYGHARSSSQYKNCLKKMPEML